MERTLDVRTGESAAFTYDLAGLGSRFLAVAIDTALQLALVVVIALLFGLAGAGGPLRRAAGAFHLSASLVTAIFTAVVIAAGFVIFIGYFIILETAWNGRTIGKRALGLRVVRDGGVPLDFMSALVRNLIRILELGLGFYALSAVSTLLNRENKRLGDLAAGTIVVRDGASAAALPHAVAAERRTTPIGNLETRDRELIAAYLARRASLEPQARLDLATRLAARIRPKLYASFAHLSDDALLAHVAEAD